MREASARTRLIGVIATVLGVALVAPFCFHVLTETDLGWHLALGRLIAHGQFPHENALAWTDPHLSWYPTSWLFDWLAYESIHHGGVIGLHVLTLVFVLLALAGAALTFHRIDPRRGLWMMPAAALLLIPRLTERPQIATWSVLLFVLWLCVPADGEPDRAARSGTGLGWQRRLACVPILAVGSNLHTGIAFAVGTLGLFCIEAWWFGGRRWREVAIAAGGALALFANPGGTFDVGYLVAHLHLGGVMQVVEMQHPTLSGAPVLFGCLPLVLLAGWRLRRRSPALAATGLVLAGLALKAVRFGVELGLVTLVLMVAALAVSAAPAVRRWAALVPPVAAGLVLVSVAPKFQALRFGNVFDASALPVRAARFIRENGLGGPMFNAFRDGGYLEWALPEERWFQDARIQAYPERFFHDEEAADRSPGAFQAWLDGQGVEWAIVSRWPERMTGRERLDPQAWPLVYWDEATEIRVRRSVPRFAGLIRRFEYHHFDPDAPVDVATCGVPALMAWNAELKRFEETDPDLPLAEVLHCAVLTRLGGDARPVCDRAAQVANTERLQKLAAQVRQLPQAR